MVLLNLRKRSKSFICKPNRLKEVVKGTPVPQGARVLRLPLLPPTGAKWKRVFFHLVSQWKDRVKAEKQAALETALARFLRSVRDDYKGPQVHGFTCG